MMFNLGEDWFDGLLETETGRVEGVEMERSVAKVSIFFWGGFAAIRREAVAVKLARKPGLVDGRANSELQLFNSKIDYLFLL